MNKEQNKRRIINYTVIVVILVVIGTFGILRTDSPTGAVVTEMDEFVDYLLEQDIKMYGSIGCSYCKIQKEDFGDSWQRFNDGGGYVECSVDREICRDVGLTGYPTWVINDELFPGRRDIDSLKELTGFV